MSKLKILISAVFLGITINSNAATITHYNIDFSSPTHSIGNLPTTGFSSDTISSVNFGQPTVEASFGSLTNQPLVFNPNINDYEQIELNLGLGYDNYKLSFDIETNNLVNSLYSFGVIFDTPQVQTLSFHGSLGLKTYNSGPILGGGIIGDFSDNSLMHIEIDVDINNNLWTINTGILPAYTGVFNANNNDVDSIRFNLSPWHGSATLDPNIYVGIDNIVVSSTVVPVPSAVWLFGSGLIGLIGIARRKKA